MGAGTRQTLMKKWKWDREREETSKDAFSNNYCSGSLWLSIWETLEDTVEFESFPSWGEETESPYPSVNGWGYSQGYSKIFPACPIHPPPISDWKPMDSLYSCLHRTHWHLDIWCPANMGGVPTASTKIFEIYFSVFCELGIKFYIFIWITKFSQLFIEYLSYPSCSEVPFLP